MCLGFYPASLRRNEVEIRFPVSMDLVDSLVRLRKATGEKRVNPSIEAKPLLAIKAKSLLLMLRNGEKSDILRELARRFYSDEASYILRRDLKCPPVPWPMAKIPIRIRPI